MRPISKSTMAKAFFSAWATVLLIVCSSLMVSHWVALPVPTSANALLSTTVSRPSLSNDTQVFHVLLKTCPCSRRVAEHLKSRQAIPGVKEYIVAVGSNAGSDDFDWRFPPHFEVSSLTSDEVVQKMGIESAPLMMITRDELGLVYSGGYTNRKQGPEIQDTKIIDAVLCGEHPDPLPVLGCAISKKLKTIVDPLGLKYSL